MNTQQTIIKSEHHLQPATIHTARAKRRSALAGLTVLALAGLIAWWARAGDTDKPLDGQRLQGSWNVTAHVEGEPLIHALITFNNDGGFVETAAAPGISAGHGNWTRTGHNQFALTALYLRLDATGHFVGTSKVRSTFTLSESSGVASGPFQTDVFDADGNMISSFGGSAEAARISVESL